MNQPLQYNRPTEVGHANVNGAGSLAAILVLLATSVATSCYVGIRTHASIWFMCNPYNWASWLLKVLDLPSYLSFGTRPSHLTALGSSIVCGIGIFWVTGILISFAAYYVAYKIVSPKSKRDVSEIVDSAKMADVSDYQRVGFLPID